MWVKDQLCEHEFILRENFDPSSDPKTMTCVFYKAVFSEGGIGLMPPSRDGNFGLETFETRISVLSPVS